MTETELPTRIEYAPALDVYDVLYLIGWALLCAGLYLALGIGWALTIAGATLLATAVIESLISDWMTSRSH